MGESPQRELKGERARKTRTFSRISRARLHSGSASLYFPLLPYRTAKLFKVAATCRDRNFSMKQSKFQPDQTRGTSNSDCHISSMPAVLLLLKRRRSRDRRLPCLYHRIQENPTPVLNQPAGNTEAVKHCWNSAPAAPKGEEVAGRGERHSPLGGLCLESSHGWKEHHSRGVLLLCICSDPCSVKSTSYLGFGHYSPEQAEL